jgi:hypothetical protein
LKNQFLAVRREVRFGIFAAKGQLLYIAEMPFLGEREVGRLSPCSISCTTEDPEKAKEENSKYADLFVYLLSSSVYSMVDSSSHSAARIPS